MNSKSIVARLGPPLLATGLIITAWEAAISYAEVPDYLFPAPSRVLLEIISNFDILASALGITMLVSVLGLTAGSLLALSLALLIGRFMNIRRGLLPILIAIQAIPVIALAPYFLIWFGPGLASRVALACILVFLPGLLVTVEGLRVSSGEAGRLFDSVRASAGQRFRWLTVPVAIPAIASAVDVTAALSVIGAIVAELSGQPDGIGFLIIQASYDFDTPRVFSALAMAAFGSFALYLTVRIVTTRLRTKFAIHYESG